MSYAQIDTRAARHLKLARVSADARWLWVQGLCFVQDAKTDGFIPDEAVPALGLPLPAPEFIRELVAGNLWHSVRGGYEIHDYLQWNASAALREQKSQSARTRVARFREREKAARTIDSKVVRQELSAGDFEPPFPIEEPGRPGLAFAPEHPPVRSNGNTLKISSEAPPPNPAMRGHRSALGTPAMDYERLKSRNGYVGVRFNVPMQFHKELVARYGGDEAAAETALAGFYRKLDDGLSADASIPNIYTFINGHFAAFVADRAAPVPATIPGGGRRADDQRAPVDQSMRDQLSQAANKKGTP